MYVAIINYRALKCGRRRATLSRVVTGIIETWFTIQGSIHAEEIRDEFMHVAAQTAKSRLPRFYDSLQLAAIAGATGATVPDVVRFGGKKSKSRRAQAREAERALYSAAGGPKDSVLRDTRRPREVRGRCLGLGPTAGSWSENPRITEERRAQAPRPSHFGLEQSTPPNNWFRTNQARIARFGASCCAAPHVRRRTD